MQLRAPINWLVSRWHRRTLGELYLIVTALGSFLFGSALLFLPSHLTSSATMATLYSIFPRATWGVLFYVLIGLCVYGLVRPSEERLISIMSITVLAQTAWAVGLTLPSLQHLRDGGVSNVLAPIAWVQLAGTAVIVVASRHRPVLPPSARNRRQSDPAG